MNILIIAGGESRRMGRNKSLIERPDGTRQIDHIRSLAEAMVTEVHLSVRDSSDAPVDLPVITDLRPGEGPLAALEAASAHCGGPWLVIGCDLFLLDAATLRFLIERRDPGSHATCYRNRIDGRPEPLCAIYEASGLALAAAALDQGVRCARRFLESLDPVVLDLPDPVSLDNANTPGELAECFAKIRLGTVRKTVEILYFARLREARGLDRESIETLACTAAGLYEEIRFRHRLPLDADMLRVAINGDFADWTTLLSDGDEVVFIPPVAGG